MHRVNNQKSIAQFVALTIALVGVGLSIWFYYFTQQVESRRVHSSYEKETSLLAKEIENALHNRLVKVAAVANLFASSKWVDYGEFERLINLVYIDMPEHRSVSWLAQIEQSQLNDFKHRVQEQSYSQLRDFDLFNLVDGNVQEATAENSYYYPLTYIYPPAEINNLIGRNIGSHSSFFPLIQQSLTSLKPSNSGFRKVFSGDGSKRKLGYILFYPIHKTEPGKMTNGFIVSGNYIEEILESIVSEDQTKVFSIRLIDHFGNQYNFNDNTINIDSQPDALSSMQTVFNYSLGSQGEKWTLQINVLPMLNVGPTLLQNSLTLAGFILSISLGLIAYILITQQSRLKQQVNEQTVELTNVVDELKEKNEQLGIAIENANDAASAKSEFLANMSHEIRTPLNGIVGLTELCRRTKLDSKQLDYLQKIDISAKHLAVVINDILDFSKLEAGKLDLDEHPFSIYSIVDNLYAILAKSAADKGITFNVTLSSDIHPDLLGDSVRINQVLLNLCSNAIKFTKEGHVFLAVSAVPINPEQPDLSDYRFSFMISDTGIGIEKDKMEMLFDNFTQADLSTTREYGGTGLGLSISQTLCKLMGGNITVESELGKGSCFTATLIVKLNDQILIENDTSSKFAIPPKVMVVDDNPCALQIIAEKLSMMDAKVSVFKDPLIAMRDLKQGKEYDAIILDWTMPGMSGKQFLLAVNEFNTPPVNKIIILSAYDCDIIKRESIDLGVDYILSKPCKTDDLFEAIESISDNVKRSIKPVKLPLVGKHIVVAEDNEINRQIIKEIVTSSGARVTLVEKGNECVEVVHRDPSISLVLMDIQMPEMDGVTATKIIRHSFTKEQIPIIALTANVLPQDTEKYLESGMNHHLGKPFEAHKVITTILSFIGDKT